MSASKRDVLPLLLRTRDAGNGNGKEPRKTGPQLLVCSASLALQARTPYALQSATKAGLKFFVDALREEYRGKVRVMTVLPPCVNTDVFRKAGDDRDASQYPPASRVADAIRFMLGLPPDVCVPELLMELTGDAAE